MKRNVMSFTVWGRRRHPRRLPCRRVVGARGSGPATPANVGRRGGCAGCLTPPPHPRQRSRRSTLPAGFTIEEFATGVKNARSMARGAKGTLFVGTRPKGKSTRSATGTATKADPSSPSPGLNMPNGVAFRDGALYVAEVSRVLRYDGIEDALESAGARGRQRVAPTDRHHGWKFIAFGPDGWLYVPVGAPCNVCDERADSASPPSCG